MSPELGDSICHPHSVGCPGAGVTNRCEPLDVGTGAEIKSSAAGPAPL